VPNLAVKNCENRLIFREVIDMSKVSCLLTHSVDIVVPEDARVGEKEQ